MNLGYIFSEKPEGIWVISFIYSFTKCLPSAYQDCLKVLVIKCQQRCGKEKKIKGDFKDINVDLKNGSVIC